MEDKQLPRKITEKIDKLRDFGRSTEELAASVIIVTYNIAKQELEKTLDSLDNQSTTKPFEVIIVDNGNKWNVEKMANSKNQVSSYLKLKKNHGLNIARNIGAQTASGKILIFLDDDGIPAKNFIKGHLRIYDQEDVVAARGKVLPKNKESILNKITGHYDFGDQPFPYYINTEGNSSIKRDLFLDLKGVNESITGAGGHEGAEISYRIYKKTGKKDAIYYNPHAVIYHDYSPDLVTYFKKQIRHKKHGRNLKEENPELFKFIKNYQVPKHRQLIKELGYIDRIKLKLIRLVNKLILKFV
jgi:glycosyltransferase involved in cell wall biosynthesis